MSVSDAVAKDPRVRRAAGAGGVQPGGALISPAKPMIGDMIPRRLAPGLQGRPIEGEGP